MSRPPDDPALGEVNRLLRQLEQSADADAIAAAARRRAALKGDASHLFELAPPGGHAQQVTVTAQKPSPGGASVSFLVANAVIATATCTSLAWHMYLSSHPRLQPQPRERQEIVRESPPDGEPRPRVSAARPLAPPEAAQPRTPAPAVPEPLDTARRPAPVSSVPKPPPDPPQPIEPPQVVPSQPRLVLAKQIELAAAQPARIGVAIEPPGAVEGPLSLAVRGLPKGVEVVRGAMVGTSIWIAPLASPAELELKSNGEVTGQFEVSVELLDQSSRSVARTSFALIVARPPPAPPTAIPAERSVPDEAARKKMLAQGLELFRQGHVDAARQVLERAVMAGDAEAALALGDTYDHLQLMRLGVRGIAGDSERAAYWYERADELGSTEAKERILQMGRREPGR